MKTSENLAASGGALLSRFSLIWSVCASVDEDGRAKDRHVLPRDRRINPQQGHSLRVLCGREDSQLGPLGRETERRMEVQSRVGSVL